MNTSSRTAVWKAQQRRAARTPRQNPLIDYRTLTDDEYREAVHAGAYVPDDQLRFIQHPPTSNTHRNKAPR